MNDLLVYLIGAGAAAYFAWLGLRKLRGEDGCACARSDVNKGGCSGGCGGCSQGFGEKHL